jgi:hypothetical protein
LRALRVAERLARVQLTTEERSRVRVIVQQARAEVTARLADDRRERERPAEAASAPQFTPPRLALLTPSFRRVVWLSVGAAAALAALTSFMWLVLR